MTLILSVLHHGMLNQAVDRLTTISLPGGGCHPYDAYANKNVIYCPRHAMVSLAYTGRAELDGMPTDQWIAQVLWGDTLPMGTVTFQEATGIRMASLGEGIERLRSECEAAFSRLTANQRREHPLDIVVAGYQRTASSDRKRPVLWDVRSAPSGSGHFDIVRQPDNWNFMDERTLMVAPVQPEWTAREGAWLEQELQKEGTLERFENVLAETIALTARRLAVVGSDSIIIRLDPLQDPQILVRYVPAGERIIAHLSPDGTKIHPVAFSPFVVTPTSVMRPSIMGGGAFSTTTGGVTVELRGDPNNPNMFLCKQPRGFSADEMVHHLSHSPHQMPK